MDKDLEKIDKAMDLSRTEKLFDASINKADANSNSAYDSKSLKEGKLVLGFGNLHNSTAKTKLGLHKLIGYRDNIAQMQKNLERKFRNSKKYKS